MAHLIDKDALVAEIERRKKKNLLNEGAFEKDIDILSFLDTLKVKEVDLGRHLKEDIEDVFFDLNGVAVKGATHYLTVEDIKDIAKHFFELGLNASNPLTWEDIKLIWTIGDEIPYMPEEDFFKELLKRFKAQKGDKV